jgi:hypothetical protein
VKSEKKLNARQEDGATLRQHYQMAEKHGHKVEELIQPVVDVQVKYLWRWFCELSHGRDYNNVSPNTLKWSEINSWSNMMKRNLNEWEVFTLLAMDRSFIND